MLTGRRLCACVEIETHFTFGHLTKPGARRSSLEDRPITTCEKVNFSDAYAAVGGSGTPLATLPEAKMSLFQPNFRVENLFPRSFSATIGRTGPLNACHSTTQQALSAHLYSFASTPSNLDLDEKHKNRVISPGRGETRLNSCVCEMYECRYSTDNNSAVRACCAQSIERSTAA